MEYFLIRLKANKDLLSIHVKKHLTTNDYHPIMSEEIGEYQNIVPITEVVENRNCDIQGESYLNYQMQPIKFRKVNDFSIDGFWYDQEKEVIVYGYVSGIYAEQRKDYCYYDVFTKKRLPWNLIDSASEIETEEDFQNMIQDLELIEKHKSVYIQLTQERLNKLEEGINNFIAAQRRYEGRMNSVSHSASKSWYEQEQAILAYKEKVKELITGSKN